MAIAQPLFRVRAAVAFGFAMAAAVICSAPVAASTTMTVDKALVGLIDNDSTGTYTAGDQLDYAVTARNTGTTTLTGVVVSDDHSADTQTCATLIGGSDCVFNVSYIVTAGDALAGQVTNIGSATAMEISGVLTASVTTPIETLPPTLALISGDGQAGYGGQTSGPLVVELRDGSGNPMPGETINWSGGNFGATVTDANGRSSNTVSFGGVTGFLDVVASYAPAQIEVHFSLQSVSARLLITSGDGQSGAAGTTLPNPLVVTALDDGNPVGAPLLWTVNSGDASVSPPSNNTDENGEASATLTFGPTAGPVQVTVVRIDGSGESVVFNLSSMPIVRALVITGGDGGQGGSSLPFPPLQVRAEDNGVGVAGVTVDWAVTSGSASIVVPSTVTDATGATANNSVIAGAAGPVTVTATRTDDATAVVNFHLTAIAAPTLAVTSGDGQSGLTGTVADEPLEVTLLDGFGNPMAGESIQWNLSGPGSLSAISTLTDSAGKARVALTFGATAGSISVLVSGPATAGYASFTATAVSGGLRAAGGDNQSGPVNSILPLPLKVAVIEPAPSAKSANAGTQALDGVSVTFTVGSGGGAVAQTTVTTDANGEAATAFTLGPSPGAQTVTASIAGGATVTFTATAILDRTLTAVSGDGQFVVPGRALSLPLVVQAQDNGVVAPGVGITWSIASGSATLTPSSQSTDADGRASTTVTAGATPGALTIRAERNDDPGVFVIFSTAAAELQQMQGLSREQRELAMALDDACPMLAALPAPSSAQADLLARCQDLIAASVLDSDATTDALDQLLPGLAGAMAESAFNAAQSQFQNLKTRIAALRSGTQGSSFRGLALTAPGGSVSLGDLGAALVGDDGDARHADAGANLRRWGWFASGNIGRGEAEAGSSRPAYDYDIAGLSAGLDYRYSDTFIVGAALGYTRQDTELQARDARMAMTGWSLSGYATFYRGNSWYSDAVLTWGRNRFDLRRRIAYALPTAGGGATAIDQIARSHSDGDMLEAAFTFGRDFERKAWSIGPYGRLLYTRLSFDPIVEQMQAGPGSGLGLRIDPRALTSLGSEIGAKFTYAHRTDWGLITPHLQLAWEHEFKDDPGAMTARFLADPGNTPLTFSGDPVDNDFLRVSLGVSVMTPRGRSGFVIYERTFDRDGFRQDNLGFGIRIEF
jgi:uncharacterized repeat protein (TIGR01451 family)